MRNSKRTRRGVVVLAVAAVSVAAVGCSSVSQEDYDAGISSLRAELMQSIQDGDANTMRATTELDGRLDRVEARLQEFARDLQSMEEEYQMTVERLETQLRFNVPVYFGFNEAELTPRAQEILDRFREVADEHYPAALITAEGHTDPSGTDDYNAQLGQRRAEAAKTYLVGQGMSDERVRAVTYGESINRQNVEGAQGPGTTGWENRRVVMVIDHDGQPPAAVTSAETVGVAARLLPPTGM